MLKLCKWFANAVVAVGANRAGGHRQRSNGRRLNDHCERDRESKRSVGQPIDLWPSGREINVRYKNKQ